MSEFLAEASVLIQAQTAAFKTKLIADVSAAVKEAEAISRVRIAPVAASATGTGAAGLVATTAASDAAIAATVELTSAIQALTAAQIKAGETAVVSAAQTKLQTMAEREQADVVRKATVRRNEAVKGLQAQALSMAGLRGAIIGANPAFLVATASAILFGKAVQSAVSLESQLSVFKVTAGATADQMVRVSDAAQRLGRDVSLPGVSAGDAAQAFTELSKAGLSVENSLDGARGVLQLATAAQIDNAQATELAASALNAFGLAGEQAVHVADVLANAANDAQGSILDIGIALQQASAAGRQAGLSLEDTAGILTIFARNGIKGSDAGTLLRTLLIRLINPTDKAAKVIKDLGLNLRDASGAIDLTVFQQFASATKNMTNAQRDQAAAIIAGQDAFRGLSILARTGIGDLNAQVDSLNKSGTAAQVAQARMVGLAGAANNLGNQLNTLGTSVGGFVTGPLAALTSGLADIVGLAAKDVDALSKLAKSFKEQFPEIPGPKVGPVDTAKAESSIGEFTKKNAVRIATIGNPVVGALTAIDLLAKGFGRLGGSSKESQVNLDSLIGTLSGAESIFGQNSQHVDALASSLIQFGSKFTQTTDGVKAFENAFASASPIISAALQDGVIDPSERAAISVTALGRAFLSLHDIPVGSGLASIGANIRSGVEDAVAEAKAGASLVGPALSERIEAGERMAAITAGRGTAAIGDAMKKGLRTAFFGAIAEVRAGTQALTDAMNRILISGGGPAQIIGNLRQQFAAQQSRINAANARLSEFKPSDRSAEAKKARTRAKAEISAALQEQASLTAQIKSQSDTIVANKQSAAAEIKANNQKADQNVFDALVGGQNKIGLAAIDANATERLSDDIAVQKLIANTASREIAIIERTVKDAKARNAAIAARVQILKAAGAELDRLRKQAADAATQRAQTAADLRTELLGKRLDLAQLRVGPEGQGKDAVLVAFDAAIRDARKRKAAAKRGSAAAVDAEIAIQTFVNNRRDFLEGLKKDAQEASGTTAFDLLKEFADTFNQNAGNLINQNQPFAGPTGFTADIAQFLVRRPQTQTGAQPGVPRGDDVVSRAISANTEALNANTAALQGKGNTGVSAGVNAVDRGTGAWGNVGWANARQARRQTEARSGD